MGRGARSAQGRLEHRFGGHERARVIVVLAAVLAMSSADAATVGASAGELRRALHIDNFDIGLLVTASSLIAAVASLPFGVLADRVRRTRTMGITVLLWGVAMILSAFSRNFDELLLARLALGVVTASAGPVVASMVGDYFASAERGQVYGYILTGELVGAGIGFAVTGDVAALSWRAAFVLLALPTFLLARALFRLPEPARGATAPLLRDAPVEVAAPATGVRDPAAPVPWPASDATTRLRPASWGPPAGASTLGDPTPPPQDSPPNGSDAAPDEDVHETDAQRIARLDGIAPDERHVLRADPTRMGLWQATRYLMGIRTNVVLIVASAFGYFYLSGIETFATEFTSKQYGVPQALANVLILVIGVGAIAGVLVGGGLSDLLLRRRYLNGRILIAAVAALLTTIMFLPAVFTRSTVAAIPYLTIAGFALMAQNPPIDAARLDIVPPRLWGRAEGLRTLLRTAAQSLAPILFGATADLLGGGRVGLQWTFAIMLLPLLANGVVLLAALRTYPRDVATAAAAPGRRQPPA